MDIKKIIVITICLTLYSTAYANIPYKLNFELTPDKLLLDKLLAPLWKNINYKYKIADKKEINVLSDTVTFQMTNGSIILGEKPEPLFDLDFIDKNKVQFNWKLSKLSADLKAKLRFKFKKYGINVTHDEYFVINAIDGGISHTKLDVQYNGHIDLKIIENIGFKFKQVRVKPQNGVGSVLRYIFDHVFSEEEVDKFITEQVNIELQKWINKDDLIAEVENSFNRELATLRNTVIKFSDIANHLKIDINHLDFSPTNFTMGLNPSFSYDELKIHPCAKLLHRQSQKDNISISLNFLEQMIKNYTTYEIWNEDKLIEPLFCFGYQAYDANGEPVGVDADFHFWGREIKFKYWVLPTTTPEFSYIPNESLIKIDLNLIIKVNSLHYPHLLADGDQLRATLSAHYKLEFKKGQGLNLVFQKFDISSMTGRLRVKWNRFTPYVRLPLSLVMKQLENTINDQANENFKVTNLISDHIDFFGNIELFLEDYQMLEDSHQILFSAR